jgi:quinol monooxygenase YgiN
MIIVAGHADIDFSLMDDPYATMVTMMTATRKEAGCLGYLLVPDPIEDNRISIFERWESMAHLNAHMVTPHMNAFNHTAGSAIKGIHLKIYDATGEREFGS